MASSNERRGGRESTEQRRFGFYFIKGNELVSTIGSSVELGIASQVVKYFTDPNAIEPPDMQILFPFVESALPLVWRSVTIQEDMLIKGKDDENEICLVGMKSAGNELVPTIGSSVELGIASQVVKYFTDPNAIEPPDMQILFPFVESALPLVWRS
ncbi:unnamed protein product [Camellia sinensis]